MIKYDQKRAKGFFLDPDVRIAVGCELMPEVKECKKWLYPQLVIQRSFWYYGFVFNFFCLLPYYCICTQKLYIANFHYKNLYRFNNIFYFSGLFSASILIILAMDGFFWCKFWIRWHIFLFWVRVCRKSLDVYCGFFIIFTQEIDLSQKDWWRKDGVLLLLFWLCCKFYIGHGFCFVYGYRIDLALPTEPKTYDKD